MKGEIFSYLKNWFEVSRIDGTFTISNGAIDLTAYGIKTGQYFRIIGSILNDGVYEYGSTSNNLTAEEFTGTVVLMAVPKDLRTIIAEIEEWSTKYGKAGSGFTSEHFGDYSYTKGTKADGSQLTWKDAFRGRLAQWRKI